MLLFLYSCEIKSNASKINWEKELIGVGYIGEKRDSLDILFSYYPFENNQPQLLNNLFRFYPTIKGDTIIFPNILLEDFFRKMKIDEHIFNESSSFLISKTEGLYKFSKIKGHKVIPNEIYYKKYPNQYPKHFKYQAYKGFDKWDNFEIEINGLDSIKVYLYGSSFNPYVYEQETKSSIDDLFIASYLNLVSENRYDTITLNGVCMNGFSTDEIFVFNDSVFRYSTYFSRYPNAEILLNYFRSKIDKSIHSLKSYKSETKRSLKIKEFQHLPVAIENWEILSPQYEH